MFKKALSIFSISLLTSYFLLLTSKVHAASYSLSISPPTLEIITKPNQSFIQAFTLKNHSNQILTLVPRIITVSPLDNQGHLTVSNLKPATDLPFSFSLENSNYHLNQPFPLSPNQTIQLVLKIKSATLNQSQDFYLALALIPPNQPTLQPQSQPVITAPIFITLTPDGNFPLDLQLENFQLPILHDSTTPLILKPQLKNNSPIMIRPQGKLTIKNWRDQTVFERQLAPNLILGHTSRLLQIQKQATGRPSLVTGLKWTPSISDFGPHQFTLTIKTASGKTLINQTKIVFLFPVKYSIYLLIATLIVLLLMGKLTFKFPSNKT